MQAFKKDFPIAQCYLVYAGQREELHNDIAVLPLKTALQKLSVILTTPARCARRSLK